MSLLEEVLDALTSLFYTNYHATADATLNHRRKLNLLPLEVNGHGSRTIAELRI